jgi:glucose dehydrogenase
MCGLLLTATLSGQTADFAQLPSRNFPVAGGNLFNQRYSMLTQVNKSTIATLGAAWMVHVEPEKNGICPLIDPRCVTGKRDRDLSTR